jgi:hypothetical protein
LHGLIAICDPHIDVIANDPAAGIERGKHAIHPVNR